MNKTYVPCFQFDFDLFDSEALERQFKKPNNKVLPKPCFKDLMLKPYEVMDMLKEMEEYVTKHYLGDITKMTGFELFQYTQIPFGLFSVHQILKSECKELVYPNKNNIPQKIKSIFQRIKAKEQEEQSSNGILDNNCHANIINQEEKELDNKKKRKRAVLEFFQSEIPRIQESDESMVKRRCLFNYDVLCTEEGGEEVEEKKEEVQNDSHTDMKIHESILFYSDDLKCLRFILKFAQNIKLNSMLPNEQTVGAYATQYIYALYIRKRSNVRKKANTVMAVIIQ
jgi:hypothetical protein